MHSAPEWDTHAYEVSALKVLVIGSGGREHALCWKFAQTPGVQVFAAPGNPGMAAAATVLPSSDFVAVAESIQPALTVVGPEAPLVAGLVDQLRAKGFTVLGPTSAASQIESSKSFAKAIMERAGIPTARYTSVNSLHQAKTALQHFGYPVVLKADGLAAGKGVVIAHTPEEAETALPSLFTLSPRLVLEEFLTGEEVSFIGLTDGRCIVPLEPAQDHKAIYDDDLGPNTGGMGAYSDSRILTSPLIGQIMDTIMEPAIRQLSKQGHPFQGFLFAGLMMGPDGPKVLEFNARLGDPEAQVILTRLKGDLLTVLHHAALGTLHCAPPLQWTPDPAVCVVLASKGYPGTVRTGDPITGITDVTEATVFQSGTSIANNVLATSGGRVLGVTASAPTLPLAIETAYREVSKIHFDGMQFRKDIGKKGLRRW